MSTTIRAIYSQEPSFPATNQHPDCLRVQIGSKWYDYIGDEPDQAYVDNLELVDAQTKVKKDIDAYYAALITTGFTYDSVDYDGKFDTIGGIEAKVNKLNRSDKTSRSITAINLGNPVTVTAPGSQAKDGDEIYISGITGTTELNGHVYTITRSTNVLSLYDEMGVAVDGSAMTAYVSGGTVQLGFRWIAKDNSRVEMALSSAESLSAAGIEFQTVNKWKARNHKDAVDQLTTSAEVNDYDYT